LWALVEPLIPPRPPAVNGRTGRPRVDDRAALEGILFVLETGVPWKRLPVELGFGSLVTCWRRLRAWQDAGVWDELHQRGWIGSGSTACSTGHERLSTR